MSSNIDLRTLISQHVNGVLTENREEIARQIKEGLTSEMTDGDVLARVSFNAVHIATALSVQAVLAVLTDIGVVTTGRAAPPNLQVIPGGAEAGKTGPDTPKPEAEEQ